jgi:hypothetical protein
LFFRVIFAKELPMPEWEYIAVSLNDLPSNANDADVLNLAGKQGWELVAITENNVAYLKRPSTKPTSHAHRGREGQAKRGR